MIPILPIIIFILLKPSISRSRFSVLLNRAFVYFILIVYSWHHSIVLGVIILKGNKVRFIHFLLLVSHISSGLQILIYLHLAVQKISIHILLLLLLVSHHLLYTLDLTYPLSYIISFQLLKLVLVLLLHLPFLLLFGDDSVSQLLIELPIHVSLVQSLVHLQLMLLNIVLKLYHLRHLFVHLIRQHMLYVALHMILDVVVPSLLVSLIVGLVLKELVIDPCESSSFLLLLLIQSSLDFISCLLLLKVS